MGTNYYVNVAVSPDVTLNLHLGKTSGDEVVCLDGSVFPTVDAWLTFLDHNKGRVEVVDEYGVDGVDFVESLRDGNIHQMKSQLGYADPDDHPVPASERRAEWMDSGFLFSNSEFF